MKELASTANSIGILSIPIIFWCLILTMLFSLFITMKITNPINDIIDVAIRGVLVYKMARTPLFLFLIVQMFRKV